MATDLSYIQFVIDQLRGQAVRYKKMFGEYMVYVDEKPILLVCDNTVFVKKLPAVAELMSGAECGYPYDGAKEHYILDIENAELTNSVAEALKEVTPLPKKRVKPAK